MTNLPNPWMTSSAADSFCVPAVEEAAAPLPVPPVPSAAATLEPDSSTDHIHEIFHFARSLIASSPRQPEIDRIGLAAVAESIELALAEIDPLPIFLTRRS